MESTVLKLSRGWSCWERIMYVLGQQDPFIRMNVVKLGGHSLPLFLVCGLRKLSDIEGIIDGGIADGISMFRKRGS